MKLPDLQQGVLLRRYKRFLADIETPDGEVLTVHCPNTGAMTGCAEPGRPAWYSTSDNAKRKYPHTLELVDTGDGLVSVNTGRANALVGEALRHGRIGPLHDARDIRPEAAIPEGNGRFDFALQTERGPAWVEVKSTTLLLQHGIGAFPDAVSTRALKHVQALRARVRAGERGVLIFCAQHCGIDRVVPAWQIDPSYAAGLVEAAAAGVEVLAVGCSTDLQSMQIDRELPVDLTPPA